MAESTSCQGVLFVLVGPAGVGKNSIMVRVMADLPELRQLPVPLAGLARLALLSVRLGYQDARKLRAEPETTAADYLSARLDDQTIHALVEPFLTGVFGHAPLLTSSRVLAMIWRSFVRGRIGVPATGANCPVGMRPLSVGR